MPRHGAAFSNSLRRRELRTSRTLRCLSSELLFPEATDAGFAEAERRLAGLRQASKTLDEVYHWGIETEDEIIVPTLHAAEDELIEFIEDSAPPSLAAAAIKLREILIGGMNRYEDALEQILAVIERAASKERPQAIENGQRSPSYFFRA